MADEVKKTQSYIYPKEFFEKNITEITKGLCFVIMPFNDKMNRIYNEVISKALKDCGLIPIRADQVFDTKPIMISIMEKINESEMIIADVTGRNPNVFYELGMTHVLKDRVILLTQEVEDVPFDLRHFRFIRYEVNPEGDLKLQENLKETLYSIGLGKTGTPEVEVEESTSGEVEEVSLPELISTTINYGIARSWRTLKGEIFAKLIEFLEFEQVEEGATSLTFPQGMIRNTAAGVTFTLRPGDLSIEELVEAFGLSYIGVFYKLNKQFDIGDLVKRSRGGVRVIESVTKDSITFSLPSGIRAIISITNSGSESTLAVNISQENYKFSPGEPFLPYQSIIKYVDIDSPQEDLFEALRALIK